MTHKLQFHELIIYIRAKCNQVQGNLTKRIDTILILY